MPKAAKNTYKQTPEEKKKIDEAFQALLASQRDILSQLKFGNSSSELNYSPEGTTEDAATATSAAVVSPNASREFNTGDEYQDYHEDLKSGSTHSYGVVNDKFILDHNTIEISAAEGPEVLDFEGDDTSAKIQKKREAEATDRTTKKRRRNSSAQYFADLLPGPSELNDLDDADSASTNNFLLLDDLDFEGIIDDADADADLWEPYDHTKFYNEHEVEPKTNGENDKKEAPAETTAETAHDDDESITMEEATEAPLRRTVTEDSAPNASKEKEKQSADDMECSIQIEDLEFPKRRCVSRSSSSLSQQRNLNASNSIISDDSAPSTPISSRRPSLPRSSSKDTPTVEQLSRVLQKSSDSMKLIQDWDRKMGLKRSHSKTMQLTCKSREQLLAFLQKDRDNIAALASNKSKKNTDMKAEDAATPDSTTSLEEKNSNKPALPTVVEN